MKRRRFIGAAVLAAAAAVPTVASEPEVFGYEAWEIAVRERGFDPADVKYPFHATEEMRRWADERLMAYQTLSPAKQLEILQQELFNEREFEFSYEDALTLTGTEAFDARRGNCMAFTSMFVALSRSVGIRTFLVKVRRAPEANRDESVVVVNRHVVAGYRGPDKMTLYDFYVTSATPYIQHRVIDDLQASAMFHNNLGGAAIRDGDFDAAIRHLDIAIGLDPSWAPAWVNLGVARFRLGDFEGAMRAYERALEEEPGNSSAFSNIALLYRQQGREEEARTALMAAAEGRANPFTLIAMADVEIGRGDLDAAEKYLRRARWWYRDEPEVYDALARLERRRGNDDRAEKHADEASALRRKRGGGGSRSPVS